MRARKLVLNITAFLACLALVAGCGPSFKSGRDKSPQETKQTPPSPPPSQNSEVAPETAPADEATDTAGTSTPVRGTEAGSSSPSTQPLSINGESKLLADKLVIGASLEKIGANHKITAILILCIFSFWFW